MILSAQEITQLCECDNPADRLILPFYKIQYKANGVTGGLSCCGYDLRIAQNVVIYPVSFKSLILRAIGGQRPSFILASSIEEFNIPNNISFEVKDKSTWARRGLAVQNTIAEPGWKGYLTLELSNHGDDVLRIKAGTPIAQIIFYRLSQPTDQPYNGKYQNQIADPQPAILEN